MDLPENVVSVLRTESYLNFLSSHRSSIAISASLCHPDFRNLVLGELSKVEQLPIPKSWDEVHQRQLQLTRNGAKISVVLSADMAARLNPRSHAEILKLAKEFCDRVPLDESVHMESIILGSKIQSVIRK